MKTMPSCSTLHSACFLMSSSEMSFSLSSWKKKKNNGQLSSAVSRFEGALCAEVESLSRNSLMYIIRVYVCIYVYRYVYIGLTR